MVYVRFKSWVREDWNRSWMSYWSVCSFPFWGAIHLLVADYPPGFHLCRFIIPRRPIRLTGRSNCTSCIFFKLPNLSRLCIWFLLSTWNTSACLLKQAMTANQTRWVSCLPSSGTNPHVLACWRWWYWGGPQWDTLVTALSIKLSEYIEIDSGLTAHLLKEVSNSSVDSFRTCST